MAGCVDSVLVYGLSGSGKTTQAGEFAQYIYKKMGLKTRLISTSGGGWTAIQSFVDLGIVEPLWARDREYPFETMDLLSKGYWPADIGDPKSPMVHPKEQKDWEDVGGLVYDSMAETAEWMQNDSTKREAEGKIKISAENLPARFMDNKTAFGAPSRAGYGMIQNIMAQQVAQSKQLPGRLVMWTSLELRVTEAESGQKLTLYGPQVLGQAKTAIASAWFHNTLHLHMLQVPGKPAIRRMYLRNHYDEDKILCIAKNRGSKLFPLPEYLENDDLSLDFFFNKLEESHKKAAEQYKKTLIKDK